MPAKKAVAKKAVKKAAKKSVKRAVKKATKPKSNLDRLRELCLALPEAHEVEAWGAPTFRVKNKLFAMYATPDTHVGGGHEGVWVKATHLTQDMLVRAKPQQYFVPPYVGKGGWVGVRLFGRTNWSALDDLLRDAWTMTAPKKLAALLH